MDTRVRPAYDELWESDARRATHVGLAPTDFTFQTAASFASHTAAFSRHDVPELCMIDPP
jgi:hypothetical protein